MQYKRWLARTGVMTSLRARNIDIINEEDNENDEEEEELNQDLID
jgi:hypothetical protein